MKKKKKTINKPEPVSPAKKPKVSKFHPPLVVDNTPIRKKYIQAFKKISRELENARADWTAFEREDQPAFTRWLNSTFGKELTAIRELQDKIHETEEIFNEIEDCKYMERMTYHQAYVYVMDRRSNPEKYREENRDDEFNDEDPRSDFSSDDDSYDDFLHDEENDADEDDDLRMIFILFMEETNPALAKKMSRNQALFEDLFEEFKQFYTKSKGSSDRKRSEKNPRTDNPTTDRLRNLYRTLARRLHPDSRNETNERYDEIWHEVQVAYRDGNYERLEMLAALCDIHSGAFYETGSLSQLLEIQKEYKEQLRAIKSEIKSVKGDPAWGFSRNADKAKLKKMILNDLRESAEYSRYQLEEMESILARWSKPPKPKASAVKKKPEPLKKPAVKKEEDPDLQMEIPF